GHPGPDVLDVDQRGEAGSGFAAFNRLHRGGLLAGVSALVRTPGGGLHGYFAGSDQASGRLPRHHLDFKAAGGYVLAPPSQVNGRPYTLITQQDGGGGLDWRAVTDLLEPPQPRREPRAEQPSEVSHLADWVAGLQEGNRNAGCTGPPAGRSRQGAPRRWTHSPAPRSRPACPSPRYGELSARRGEVHSRALSNANSKAGANR
ncbi:MAG TPA: bifunctional DNA primase/polymerase, partial [Streptosporangiaceae bacterium]